MQRMLRVITAELVLQNFYVVVIGEHKFYSAKSALRRFIKALKKIIFPNNIDKLAEKRNINYLPYLYCIKQVSVGASAALSAISSNSITLSSSLPIEILVTRSRMISTTTGTRY